MGWACALTPSPSAIIPAASLEWKGIFPSYRRDHARPSGRSHLSFRSVRGIMIESVESLATADRSYEEGTPKPVKHDDATVHFFRVLRALAQVGYRVGALVMDAVRFVLHARPRLFIVGVHQGVALLSQLGGSVAVRLGVVCEKKASACRVHFGRSDQRRPRAT